MTLAAIGGLGAMVARSVASIQAIWMQRYAQARRLSTWASWTVLASTVVLFLSRSIVGVLALR